MSRRAASRRAGVAGPAEARPPGVAAVGAGAHAAGAKLIRCGLDPVHQPLTRPLSAALLTSSLLILSACSGGAAPAVEVPWPHSMAGYDTALVEALEEARGAESAEMARQALVRAAIRVEELRAALEELGLELSEWDSMQSIQDLARESLNSQKNLAERTRKQAQQGTSGSGDAGDEEDPPR